MLNQTQLQNSVKLFAPTENFIIGEIRYGISHVHLPILHLQIFGRRVSMLILLFNCQTPLFKRRKGPLTTNSHAKLQKHVTAFCVVEHTHLKSDLIKELITFSRRGHGTFYKHDFSLSKRKTGKRVLETIVSKGLIIQTFESIS